MGKPTKKYEYTARGGEYFISHSDLIGRQVLRVRRDGISKKIKAVPLIGFVTLTDKEVGIGISNVFFSNLAGSQGQKLKPGEIIEILYK